MKFSLSSIFGGRKATKPVDDNSQKKIVQQLTPPEVKQPKQKKQPKKGRRYDDYGPVRKKESKKKRSFGDSFVKAAVLTTQAPARYLEQRMPGLRDDILSSNLNIAPEGIISIAIFLTYLCIPIVAIIDYILIISGYAIIAVFVPVALVLPLALGLSLPKISASTRSAALEDELPFLIGYIAVLAGGGISPFTTIKRISKAGDIFPAGAKEAKRILLDIELFGLDPVSALEKAAAHCPNKKFSDFLGGYLAVLKTGGDVDSYLQAQLREIYAYSEIRARASTETIGTFAEVYIIATVVLGISLFIFFIAQALLTGSSQGVNPIEIELFGVVFVPGISIAFIMIVNSAQMKEPFTYYPPYYVFLASIPFGAAFFFLPLNIPIYIHLGIAFAIISTPGAIVNYFYVKKKRSVEAKLSNFVRDISEVRKTGLAPEKTIEQLAGRNYGGLTEYVKKISNQLSWGIPIRKVLRLFSDEVKSWTTRAVTFLLLEVVDVGGGSPKLFIGLAEFTERMNRINKERRSQVRTYLIVPYIGAILIIITTALMVYLLSGPGLTAGSTSGLGFIASPAVIQQAVTIMLLAGFFQAWVMGFVAGKMGELTVADGFKHATAIIVISILTVYIAGIFIKF